MRGVSPVCHSLSSPLRLKIVCANTSSPSSLSSSSKCRKQHLKNHIVTRLIFLVRLHRMNQLLLLPVHREILFLAQTEAVIATMTSPTISSTPTLSRWYTDTVDMESV